VRIHRAYVVNIERIEKIDPIREGQPRRLRDGTRLPVSRSGYQRLKGLL
jgi:two-component system LytT family response regulator